MLCKRFRGKKCFGEKWWFSALTVETPRGRIKLLNCSSQVLCDLCPPETLNDLLAVIIRCARTSPESQHAAGHRHRGIFSSVQINPGRILKGSCNVLFLWRITFELFFFFFNYFKKNLSWIIIYLSSVLCCAEGWEITANQLTHNSIRL